LLTRQNKHGQENQLICDKEVLATDNKCKRNGTNYIYDKKSFMVKSFYRKYGRMRNSDKIVFHIINYAN